MAVRVRVRVRSLSTGSSITLVVLVNGGAESRKPTIVLGTEEARELGLYPPPPHSEIYEAVEASQIRYVYVVPDAVEIELLGDGGETLSKVVADVAVEEGITEPLITDVTIDALGIQVVSFGKGLWRHVSDPEGKVRGSAA